MAKKEKAFIAPNECSLGRWIAAALVGFVIGSTISIPLEFYSKSNPDPIMGLPVSAITAIVSFCFIFICTVIAIRMIAKTSLKDFVIGVKGTVNKKDCLTVAVFYLIGYAIVTAMSAKYYQLNQANAGEFAVLFVFMLLLCWMQTTWEEIVFRGLFIRWACKNEIGYTKKAIICGIVSTLLFTIAHASNSEMATFSGAEKALAMFAYAVPGFVMYFADLHFRSLLPGIVFHWINNFIAFVFVRMSDSSMPVSTLFIDYTPRSAVNTAITHIALYLPFALYIIFDLIRRKKAAAGAEN